MNTVAVMDNTETIRQDSDSRQKTIACSSPGRNMSISIDNCLERVPDIATMLVDEACTYLDRDMHAGVIGGLCELISNAIEHGNLDITSREKKAYLKAGTRCMIDTYYARFTNPILAGRRVRVEAFMSEDFCEWTISDEGDGFDWRQVFENIAHQESNSLSERGIYLCSLRFDELTYEGRGNIVRARKCAHPKIAQDGN